MGILRADRVSGLGGRNAANGSVYFDGRDDITALQVAIGGSNADFTFGTGDFTIEFWMKHGATGSYDLLYDARRSSTDIAPMLYLVSGKIKYYTDGNDKITGTTDISHDSWHHIALCRSSGSTKLFLNGVQEGSTYSDSNSYVAKLNRPVIGGEGPNFANNPFGGFLSNLRVVKGTALYTSNFTPPTQVLKAIDGTVLLCCQDSDNPTAEATGKEMLGQGGVYYGRRFSNLATNGGLETGDTTGWTSSSMSVTPRVSTFSHSGSYSLYCETNVNGSGVYTTVDLDTTKRYKISAYIYNVTTGSTLSKMKIGTSVGANTQYESQKSTPGKWEYHEWIGIPSATTTYITFVESASGTPVVKWYVDDLRVELWYPEETENILGNGNFLTDATGWSFSSTPSGEYTISSNRLNIADTSRTSNAYATQQLWSSSIAEGKYRITVDYALTAGGFDIGVGNSNIWSLSGSGSVTAERVADGNNSNFRIIGNQHCVGYFNNVSLFRVAEPKAPVDVPPLGVDNGMSFADNTKFDTLSYMVPPKGTTESRNRGRAVMAGGMVYPTAAGSQIDYMEIQSGGITKDFGDLTAARSQGAPMSSSTRGVIGGGLDGPTRKNEIDFITIATTGNATNFGDVSELIGYLGGVSNQTRGLICGGNGPSSPTNTNQIEYITIASTGDSVDFSQLNKTGYGMSGSGSPTRGMIFGGYVSPGFATQIDTVVIASTGVNASDFGDTSIGRAAGASCSSATRALFAGGYNNTPAPSTKYNTIDYITIASTGTVNDFGDLSVAGAWYTATSNGTRGIFGSRMDNQPFTGNVTIDSVIIASTGNAVNWGDHHRMDSGPHDGQPLKRRTAATMSDSHGGIS